MPGVCRHATNHIVDQDGTDGVTVRYHNLLPMLDRLRKTADGWKIYERYVGASAMNPHFSLNSAP